MKTFRVEILVPAAEVESCSEELWALAGVSGMEEASLDSQSGIFQVPDEFEILEFGSEAAKKCAKWIHSQEFRGKQNILLRIYFLSDGTQEDADAAVKTWMAQKSRPVEWVSSSTIEDQDYAEAYRQSVRGQRVGKNLWVGPPWEEPPQNVEAFVIEPGLAFGTGDHPTTQLCLGALEALRDGQQHFSRILDLGAGTGVLALAAKRFFPAAQVLLSDIDPQCAEEFQKTLRINAAQDLPFESYFGQSGTAEALKSHLAPVDLLISNIYAEVLASSLPSIAQLFQKGGLWIASGILEGKSEDILLKALKTHGFSVLERQSQQRVRSDLNLSAGLEEESETWVLLKIQ